MFNFLKKKAAQGQIVDLKIKDMHCASCALSIDETLEEQVGVLKATTSYAHSTTKVIFDERKISVAQIEEAITKLGYSVDK